MKGQADAGKARELILAKLAVGRSAGRARGHVDLSHGSSRQLATRPRPGRVPTQLTRPDEPSALAAAEESTEDAAQDVAGAAARAADAAAEPPPRT